MSDSWRQLDDTLQKQHEAEIAEYDAWMNTEPPWWHFIEEWWKSLEGQDK